MHGQPGKASILLARRVLVLVHSSCGRAHYTRWQDHEAELDSKELGLEVYVLR